MSQLYEPTTPSYLLPRITPLPLPDLSSRLQNWLLNDWEVGLDNSNQLLAYTLQFSSVITAINKILDASLKANIQKEFIRGFFNFPSFFF